MTQTVKGDLVLATEIDPYPLLKELESQIEVLFEQHKEASRKRDWGYRKYLPHPLEMKEYWGDPRERPPLSEVAYQTVMMANLTEQNLPWYVRGLAETFKTAPPSLHEFLNWWTAEESQHSALFDSYLYFTNNGDHEERQILVRDTIRRGWTTDIAYPFQIICYVAIQEQTTYAFYVCAANVLKKEDPKLAQAFLQVAGDEILHMKFYREIVKLHIELAPEYINPLAREMLYFQMPGHVMPDFKERSGFLAKHGVFGPEHFYHYVVGAMWKEWDITKHLPFLKEELRERLLKFKSILQKRYSRSTFASARR